MICVKNIILILSLRLNLIFFFVDIVCIIFMDLKKNLFGKFRCFCLYVCEKFDINVLYIFVLGVFVIML